MKKIILSLNLIGFFALTSCDKGGETAVADAPADTEVAVQDEKFPLPELENQDAVVFLGELRDMMYEITAAEEAGDSVKVEELGSKMFDMALKGAELVATLTDADKQKMESWEKEFARSMGLEIPEDGQ